MSYTGLVTCQCGLGLGFCLMKKLPHLHREKLCSSSNFLCSCASCLDGKCRNCRRFDVNVHSFVVLDATFSENFYGLRRIPLQTEEDKDADEVDSLTMSERFRSLLILVRLVFLKFYSSMTLTLIAVFLVQDLFEIAAMSFYSFTQQLSTRIFAHTIHWSENGTN